MQKFNYTPSNPFSGSVSSLAIGAGMVVVPLVYPFGIRIGRMRILGPTAVTIIFVIGGLALLAFTVREIMQARKLIAQGGEITVEGGKVTFTLKPKALTEGTYNVYISTTDKPLEKVASFEYGTKPPYTKGDANSDGEVDANDAVAILLYVVSKYTLTGDQLLAADVNGDHTVDANDAVAVLLYIVGKYDFK